MLTSRSQHSSRDQELARTLFKGKLKGPFDVEGRAAAGLHESWYMPLTESPPASPTVA